MKKQSKFLSRKFIFAIFWALFMVAAFVFQTQTEVKLPLEAIVYITAFATIGYSVVNLVQKKMEGPAANVESLEEDLVKNGSGK